MSREWQAPPQRRDPSAPRSPHQIIMRNQRSTSAACPCDRVASRSRLRDARDRTVDTAFRAFSDVTRLRILHLLLDGEMCVGDLVTTIRTAQPTVSQHLAYLRQAGLVVRRRQGLWSLYSLAPAQSTFHRKLFECLRHCFSEVPELQADRRRAERLPTSARCCSTAAVKCGLRSSRTRSPRQRSHRESSG